MKTATQVSVLAVVPLAIAALASAQPTFEGRVAFRTDHTIAGGNIPTPPEDPSWTVLPGEILPIGMMFGAFNAQGFTDRGMFNFIGTVTVSDPAGTATLSLNNPALRNPYNLGGQALVQGDGSIFFDAARVNAGLIQAPWEEGQPNPVDTYTYPAGQGGPDSYFGQGLRFYLDPGPASFLRDITITVTGQMKVISEWYFDGGEPGDVASLIPGGFVEAPASGTIIIHWVPAPGALALLGLGGLAAARRRRA